MDDDTIGCDSTCPRRHTCAPSHASATVAARLRRAEKDTAILLNTILSTPQARVHPKTRLCCFVKTNQIPAMRVTRVLQCICFRLSRVLPTNQVVVTHSVVSCPLSDRDDDGDKFAMSLRDVQCACTYFLHCSPTCSVRQAGGLRHNFRRTNFMVPILCT